MTKRFRPWDPKQKWLLPPEITEFIPEGHPAHFVRDLVVEELDLSAILGSYVEDKGFPPFHPAMMTGSCFMPTPRACSPPGRSPRPASSGWISQR